MQPTRVWKLSMGIAALGLMACGTPIEIPGADAGPSGAPPSAVARHDGGYSGSADAGAVAPPDETTEPGQKPTRTGVLTAGSIDDHLNPEVFDAFLEHAKAFAQQAPSLAQRAEIVVTSATGAPVGNAVVRVHSSAGKLLLETRTGTDGRTVYLPSLDGELGAGLALVEARASGITATGNFALADAPWKLTLAAPALAPQQLDLAFIVDTTGSMGDELEFLKAETANIAAKVAAQYPHVDMRFGLIVYRDTADTYVTRSFPFGDLAAFQSNLGQQQSDGGGDYPEAVHLALAGAAQQLAWREGNVARVAFWIADAPPHDDQVDATFAAFDTLRKAAVRVYPVASSGVADLAEFVMRAGAFVTLARYVFLTDDSGVGGTHAEPHMPAETTVQPCYVIEKLEHLMIRMISSELAGKLLAPDPANVLRTVGNPVNGVCQPVPQPPAAQ